MFIPNRMREMFCLKFFTAFPSSALAITPRRFATLLLLLNFLNYFSAAQAAALTSTTLAPAVPRALRPDAPALSASPAPALAAPRQEEITPPLSLFESCQMLSSATRRLSEKTVAADPAALQQVDRILMTIILYVDRVDRANPTLPYYAWQEVSADKAPRDGWETQIFKLRAPLPQVTALSLRVRHGDVDVKYLAAFDKNQTRWEFLKPIHVPADQPRPEIFFLSLPTALTEVRITCRRSDPTQRWARLNIDAGISGIPESAKQAIYYLQVARAALKNRKPADARIAITQAYVFLREYQKNRRF